MHRRSVCNRGEDGQTLVLFAGGMVILLALLALSIDVGRLVVTRSNLQTSADAGALAAAQDLPNPGSAEGNGASWASLNTPGTDSLGNAATTSVNVSTTNTANDTVTVSVERQVPFTFGKLVGLDTATIEASATARIAYYNGGTGVQPWGLVANGTNACFKGMKDGVPQFEPGATCKIKEGSPNGGGGDFGILELDGTGANEYYDDIVNGSQRKVSIGDLLQPEPGNKVGKTRQGIEDRLAQGRPAGCPGDGFNDIFVDNGDDTYSIRPGCAGHPRIVVIPVVDQIDHQGKAEVLGFAFMYIEEWEYVPDSGNTAESTGGSTAGLAAPGSGNNGNGGDNSGSGNNGGGNSGGGGGQGHVEIYARFVNVVTEIPGGDYSGTRDTGASIVRLVD